MAGYTFTTNLPPSRGLFQGNGNPTPPVQPPAQMQQPVLPQPPQDIFAKQQQITPLQRNGYVEPLLATKQEYEEVRQILDEMGKDLQNPDIKQEDRDKLEKGIKRGESYLGDLNKQANYIRETAGNLGIDLSPYGSDVTAQKALQNWHIQTAKDVRDLLGAQTPREQEEARYRELRANGASPAQAHRIVNREREGFQEDFLSRLSGGIMAYGTNADGSLNDVGLMLAQRMNPDNPQMAVGLFANAFALPRNVFDAENQRANTLLQSDSAMKRAALNAEMQLARLQNAREIANSREEGINRRFAIEQDNKFKLMEIRAALGGGGSRGGGSLQEKIIEHAGTLMEMFGYSAEEALKSAQKKFFPDTVNEELEKFNKKFGNVTGNLEKSLKAGNKDDALASIASVRELLDSNAENLTQVVYDIYNERLDLYEKLANGDGDPQQIAVRLYELQYFQNYKGRWPTDQEVSDAMASSEWAWIQKRNIRTPTNPPNNNPNNGDTRPTQPHNQPYRMNLGSDALTR